MKARYPISRLLATWMIICQMIFLPTLHAEESTDDSTSSKTLSINECNDDPAREWNSARGICAYKQESVDDRDEYRECAELEGEAQKECHKNYAEKRTGKLTADSTGDEGKAMTIAGINLALAAINLIWGGSGSSNCMSKTIHMGTALAGTLAELYFKFMAKKELEELQKRYAEEEVNKDPFAAQKRAFDFLEDQQKKIADYAKKRKIGYTLLLLGYTAAAGVAAYELMQPQAQKCYGEGGKGGEGTGGEGTGGEGNGGTNDGSANGSSNSYYNPLKEMLDLFAPEAHAATPMIRNFNPTSIGVTSKVLQSTNKAMYKTTAPFQAITTEHKSLIDKVMDMVLPQAHASFATHPGVILAVSLVSAYMTNQLRAAAADQEEEAKANAEKVAKIKAKFEAALGNFCPSGHEDMSDARCFCYTSDGKKNNNRTNSDICQRLWAQDNKNLFAKAGSYGSSAPKKAGCMTRDRQFDQNCKCKKFKDDSGQNACFKAVPNPTAVPPNVQSAFSLPQVAASLDSVNSGTAAGSVDGVGLNRALAKATKARDKMLKKLNDRLKAKGQSTIPSGSSLGKKFLKNLYKAPILAASKNAPTIQAAVPTSPAIAKALKEAEKKSGIAAVGKPASAEATGAEKKKKRFGFNLDDEGNKVVDLGDDPADAQYDYGENDINDDPDQNLFDIITRRYNLTGLERLFDE
jgi:hypothetical protein